MAGRDQRPVLPGPEADGEQPLHQGFDLGLRNVEGDGLRGARRDIERWHGPLGEHDSVRRQLPASREVGEIREGAPVLDLDQPRPGVERPDPDRLIDLLHLEGVRVWLAVGGNQAVHQEVAVGRDPRRPDVAPVGPKRAPGFVFPQDRLVHPVPDEAAHQLRIAVDHLPVIGQVPDAVSHGVGVFDQQEGLFRPRRRVVLEPVGTDVHGRHDVHDVAFARRFVEDRTPGVELADPLGGGVEVLPVPGLVAERPDDHRWMIPVADHHPLGAVEMGVPPLGTPRERHLGQVAHAVRLDVRFVHHVEPVLVGQLVEAGQVRVVGRPYRVDVQELHEPDVFQHGRFVHHVSPLGVVLVPVHSPEHDGPSVQQQLAVRRLDPPEPDPDRGGFGHPTVRADERQHQPVEMRGLGGPGADIGDRLGGSHGSLAPGRHVEPQLPGAAPDRVVVRVEQLVADFVGPRLTEPPIRDAHAEVHDAVAVSRDQVGVRREVPQEGRRPGEEGNLAVDAADPPEILALQIAAVAPANDLHRERVRSGRDLFGDPELGRRPAPLAVADEGAVHPDVKRGVHPVEPEEDFAVVPPRGDLEGAPVGPHRVVVFRHERRVCRERIGLVPIHGIAVAEQLPVRGHRDLVPGGVVEARLEEPLRPVSGAGDEVELPVAVQRDPAGRVLGTAFDGCIGGRKRREGGPGRLAADLEDHRILPGRWILPGRGTLGRLGSDRERRQHREEGGAQPAADSERHGVRGHCYPSRGYPSRGYPFQGFPSHCYPSQV